MQNTTALSIYAIFTGKSLLVSDICNCAISGSCRVLKIESAVINMTVNRFTLKKKGIVHLFGVIADGSYENYVLIDQMEYVIEEKKGYIPTSATINKNGKRRATDTNNRDEFDYGSEYTLNAKAK